MNRREWVRRLSAGTLGVAAVGQASQQPAPDSGVADPLQRPDLIGQMRSVATRKDSDPVVIATERRIRCTCGCGLDVYTCRTTDFSCTYSPALHREAMELFAAGKSPDQVVSAFVAKYGETVLMAPKAQGFNLLAYFVPGTAVVVAAGLLVWVLRRRRKVPAIEPAPAPPPGPGVTPDALERVEQALRDVR
jgi:cytochrome c-type biogenesis protein CcmH